MASKSSTGAQAAAPSHPETAVPPQAETGRAAEAIGLLPERADY